MQSVLPKALIVLSLQRVGCWRSLGPTAPPSIDNPTAPAPTQAPLRRADIDLERSNSPPCAKLSGDASVSDYIFNCPADQICQILPPEGNYWGCCKEVPVPGCVGLSCPTYSSCIDSTALGSCDSDCMTDPGILKCSGSAKPFCAIGSASMSTSTGGILYDGPTTPLTTLSQYACADYPYTLHYTVFADYLYEARVCAPPWVENPTSLAAWSKSAAPQLRTATIQDFADPFDLAVSRANFSASTVLPFANGTTTSAPTVRIPTAPSASSTTTTSAGVRWVVSTRHSVYILSLLLAGQFMLS